MYKVNDVTNWLSQTTDNSSIFSGPLDFEIKRVACIPKFDDLHIQYPYEIFVNTEFAKENVLHRDLISSQYQSQGIMNMQD